MRTISVEGMHELGSGGFGTVYRYSRRQVVKVIHRHACGRRLTDDDLLALVFDEIEGARELEATGIAVIHPTEVVIIEMDAGEYTLGLLKKYLHLRPSWVEVEENVDWFWDRKPQNCRKDHSGKVFVVDTATRKCCDIYWGR